MSIQTVVAVGVDPHVDTIAVAGVDGLGVVVWEATAPNTPRGIEGLVGSAGSELWAVEGSGALGRLLADSLIRRGVPVFEVPTRLTARLRLRAGFSKSDRADAAAIARLALAETLPPVDHDPIIEALRVLVGQRESLVRGQVEASNRIRARLRELDSEAARRLPRLRSRVTFEAILELLPETDSNPHRQALIVATGLEAQDCIDRMARIRRLETEIRNVIPPAGRKLMEIPGIGLITAAMILAATGNIGRFPTEGHYARYAGTAPLDASSGRQQRHRLNRWGNRSLNQAIHIAIVTQLQRGGQSHQYITRRIAEGKTKQEAIRAAKRYLTRHIYRTLKTNPLT
jgi:transposase